MRMLPRIEIEIEIETDQSVGGARVVVLDLNSTPAVHVSRTVINV